MKSKKNIPVYCFNEHNEAFYFWHRARVEGRFSRPLDLFHIDAHDDMARPRFFSESVYVRRHDDPGSPAFFKRFAANHLSISDFIFPAVLTGVVRNVYYIYPKWRKYKPVRKKFSVCSAFGEGKVLKYGIKIKKGDDPMISRAYPDLTSFYFMMGRAEKLPLNRRVLLDIDLDYFACRDSVTNHLHYELEVTRKQFIRKDLFIKDKTLPFSGIVFTFFERNNRYFVRIERKKTPEVFHFPGEDEIEREINSLVGILMEKKVKPSVVTICRSCDSGFCPEEKARFIEPLLLEKIQPLIA